MLFVIYEQHRLHSVYVIFLLDWFHCDAFQKREKNRVNDSLFTLEFPASVQVQSLIIYAINTSKNLIETLKR
jgi:hypothetical protein